MKSRDKKHPSWWESKSCEPLTLKTIQKGIDILKSEEYNQKMFALCKTRAEAESFINRIFIEKKISEHNYWKYMTNINLNGMLIISPTDKLIKFM